MRENSQNIMRPNMMNPNQYAMRANMRNGMVNGGAMPNAEMAKRMLVCPLSEAVSDTNAYKDSAATSSDATAAAEDAATATDAAKRGRRCRHEWAP